MTTNPYLALVNKQNLYSPEMSQGLKMVHVFDTDGITFCEQKTYMAYRALNQFLIDNYGIALFLTSAGRSVKTQQKVLTAEAQKSGSMETALQTVALPGTSEHHTGLALDVKPEIAHPDLIQAIVNNIPLPEKLAYPKQPEREQKDEMYAVLHQHLAEFGFILRYTKAKQEITGYKPERWHIRYVGKEYAKEIEQSGLCLEEYLSAPELQPGSGE